MIEVKNLVKRYGDHTAVNGISFTVEPGKIYGLLGPNGAGKSTTMNIITGCLAATSGSVTINGHDIFENPKEAKKCIGYLPEIPPLYTDMTPLEYLTFVAEAKKVRSDYLYHQVNEVIEITGLTDYKNRLIKNLSKGYRQRVGIAQAMLGNPDIIILDEPTVGLDPKQILEIRELIRQLGENKTIILSSHILAEISAVCDHVMIISHGNLVANDSLESLEEMANRSDKLRITVRGDKDSVTNHLTAIDGVINCVVIESSDAPETDNTTSTNDYELELTKDKDVRDSIFFAMAEIKCPVISMQYERTTLEDIFLALTDDSVIPDENGVLPSVEDILEGKVTKKTGEIDYESLSDEELAKVVTGEKTDSIESEVSADENNIATETEEPKDTQKTDGENPDDYKPLFGGRK